MVRVVTMSSRVGASAGAEVYKRQVRVRVFEAGERARELRIRYDAKLGGEDAPAQQRELDNLRFDAAAVG